jgi:acyl carrier protein
MTTREKFVAEMLSWLNDRLASKEITIEADTPLFERRLLDSIRVLELIAYTERAIGSVIPDSRIRMDNFRTASRIAEAFVQEAEDAAA